VERAWDEVEGEVAPKSKQGRRKVPIPAVLRDHLDAWLLVAPGERPNLPQRPRELRPRPRRRRRAGVDGPSLPKCRHAYASGMIAAGVNVKSLSTFMGHANIRITLDQYGHLLPGAEDEAAGLLDAFLVRQLGASKSETAPRIAPHPA
jgi:integrase